MRDEHPGGEPPSLLGPPDDETFMRVALQEALLAYERGEVPVGAVVVDDGRIIGRGHNLRETLNDPTAHAEMLALTAAAEARGEWRLDGCSLYVTLEPCPMCAGAIVNARIKRVVFGASDPKAGACGTLFNLVQDARLNHRTELQSGLLSGEAGEILKSFFREARAGTLKRKRKDEV
ncbi:MAG: tRNA adenosine(34) deaminase TadA [Planctomycetes bacterium]|nr:tRNA adenosine(34) deaminase TadA [Planctomycetota bacterium]